MVDTIKRPGVGVTVIVMKDNKVLLGKRKSAHGEGSWGFPGGHLELNESIEDCVRRETQEETGLTLDEVVMGPFTNDIFEQQDKHYVTLFTLSRLANGEARVMEPDKCEQWEWFTWDNLPQPLFLPIQNLLKQGYDPFNH